MPQESFALPSFAKKTQVFETEESMEMSALRQKPHLPASSINDYLDCGLLYLLGRVLKLQPEIRPDALEFGSIIHFDDASTARPYIRK